MDTVKILDNYIPTDITNIIIQFAFDFTSRQTLLTSGHCEKSEEVIHKINGWKLSKNNRFNLKKVLTKLVYSSAEANGKPNMNIINIVKQIDTGAAQFYPWEIAGAYKSGNFKLIESTISKIIPENLEILYTKIIDDVIIGGTIDLDEYKKVYEKFRNIQDPKLKNQRKIYYMRI